MALPLGELACRQARLRGYLYRPLRQKSKIFATSPKGGGKATHIKKDPRLRRQSGVLYYIYTGMNVLISWEARTTSTRAMG